MEKRERELIKCFIDWFGVEKILECIGIKDIINNIDIDDIIDYLRDDGYVVYEEGDVSNALDEIDNDDIIDYLRDGGYLVYGEGKCPSYESIIERVEDICREIKPNGYIGKEEAKELISGYLDIWMDRGFL